MYWRLTVAQKKRVRSMAEFEYAGEQFFLHVDLGHPSLVAVSHCQSSLRAFTLSRYSGTYNLTFKPCPTDTYTLVEKAIAKFDSIGLEKVRAGIERAKVSCRTQGERSSEPWRFRFGSLCGRVIAAVLSFLGVLTMRDFFLTLIVFSSLAAVLLCDVLGIAI